MTKLGLVLSGGGAKGSYEIGVVLALKRLGKKFDIVTGTSIGALNGLFVASKDVKTAVRLWRKMNFGMIYDEKNFTACSDDNILDIYKEYAKSFLKEGGLNVSKIEDVIDKYFKLKKFMRSNIDYGLVTYNITKHKPKIMKKQELINNPLKDYVIASASCYPAFKPKKIGNDLYIDGGYYDNMPINLAIEMGAEDIIAVDLRAVGFKRKPENKGIPVTIIAPKNNIGSFLVFDKIQSREAMKFGYNDTLKKYGKLDGDYFTFKKSHLVKNYNRYNEKVKENLRLIAQDGLATNIIFNLPIVKGFLNDKLSYRKFNKLIEYGGKVFGFRESTIYGIKSYNRGLLNELDKTSSFSIQKLKDNFKDKKFLNLVDKREIVKMFYLAIKNNQITDVLKYIVVFPDEFLLSVYLYAIK